MTEPNKAPFGLTDLNCAMCGHSLVEALEVITVTGQGRAMAVATDEATGESRLLCHACELDLDEEEE